MNAIVSQFDHEKFRKCHALMLGGATDGERQAARAQAEKIAKKAGIGLVDAIEQILAAIPALPVAAPSNAVADLFPQPEPQPFLWLPGEACLILHAAGVFMVSEKTMRKLVKRHKIFVQAPDGSTMLTCLAAVSMVLSCDFVAIEMLRNDQREEPRVRRHFDYAKVREANYFEIERLRNKRPA